MSGFLNLGGDAGAMVQQTPVRVIGTPFMISAARPALVVYTINVALTGGAAASDGEVALRSDRNNPPTTTIAAVRFQAAAGAYAGASVNLRGTLVGLILPGHFANIVIVSGSNAALTIAVQSEVIL